MLCAASKRTVLGIGRRFRETRMFAKAMRSPRHPIQAHIVPVRRCNLSCTYCNEFDDRSTPVPTPEMISRIGHLARLGTTIITISGGEPLLHPDLDEDGRRCSVEVLCVQGVGMVRTIWSFSHSANRDTGPLARAGQGIYTRACRAFKWLLEPDTAHLAHMHIPRPGLMQVSKKRH